MKGACLVATTAATLGLAGAALAGGLTVGSGASVALGSGSLALGEGDLTIAGTFSAGSVGVESARHVSINSGGTLNGESASIELCGNWSNLGSFNAGTGSVEFGDGCSLTTVVVSGNTTFNALDFSTATGKEVQLSAGSTQTVTGALMLAGATGNLLVLRSTSAGSDAFLNATGSSFGAFVDVNDVDATGGSPIDLSTSVLGSNAPGWILAAMVPLFTPLGLVALALGLVWRGCRAVAPRA